MKLGKLNELRAHLDRDLILFLESDKSLFDDPIHCVDKNLPLADAELLSFIVSGLSYGRVEQIKKSCFDLIKRLSLLGIEKNGSGLANFLIEKSEDELAQSLYFVLDGWKHRLNTRQDLISLLLTLQRIKKKHKSLCAFFQSTHTPAHPEKSLMAFSENFLRVGRAESFSKNKGRWSGTGISWFVPSPADKGSCKKLLMWLRWMVRKDQFDLGLWQSNDLRDAQLPELRPSQLFVPVDTHLQKWALSKKITRLKSPSWKMTKDVSDFFRTVSPDDPLKYDFMICHEGMRLFRSAPSSASRQSG